MLKKTLSIITLLTLLIPVSTLANFSDVSQNHPYREAITELSQLGCISGYGDGTFKPDNIITRAETLKLILTCIDLPGIYTEETFQIPAGASYTLNGQEVRLEQDSELRIKVPFNPSTYPDLEFRDLNQGAWYVDVLKEGLVREVITGYADNTIKAERTVNKGEFFTMLFRVVPQELRNVDLSSDIANDALIGQWFTESLGFAVQNNIIDVDSENNLHPFRELNRGQVAHFINIYRKWITPRLANSDPAPTNNNIVNINPTQNSETVDSPSNSTSIGFTQEGKASFMGRGIAGNRTASGDTYDPEARTAAHPSIAFNQLVRVTNKENGKFVCVRINDRGPNQEIHPDRIIDLSFRAFGEIAEISQGIVDVKIEVIEAGNCVPNE